MIIMRMIHLKNLKQFQKLAKRTGQIKPLTNEELTKRLEKLEKEVHSLEMMIMDTRARLLQKLNSNERLPYSSEKRSFYEPDYKTKR